jgi:hypothetical protein
MKRFSAQLLAASRVLAIALAGGLLFSASTAHAALVYALTDENDLLSFDSATPADLIDAGAILGLNGQDLIGIDIRPATGQLYGVGNLGGIFAINPVTKVASFVANVSVPLVGSRFGVDFNPVVDRLRIVSDVEQNLRVDVTTGAALADTPLAYGPGQPGATGDNPSVVGAAYTNSLGVAGSTALYDIDVRTNEDRLVRQDPANSGLLTVIGPLGVNASSLQGFDILFDGVNNIGFAALQLTGGGISQLYSIDLATGAASLVGDIGGGDLIDGLAIVPIPEPATLATAALALIGAVFVRRSES